MSLSFEEVREYVLKLGKEEQALKQNEHYEDTWFQEAASRYRAYKEGKIESTPAEIVHRRILESRK